MCSTSSWPMARSNPASSWSPTARSKRSGFIRWRNNPPPSREKQGRLFPSLHLRRVLAEIHADVVLVPVEQEQHHAIALAAEAIGRIGGHDQLARLGVIDRGGELGRALGQVLRIE